MVRVRARKGVRRVRCRPKVEHYVALDIRKLQDYGLLRPGTEGSVLLDSDGGSIERQIYNRLWLAMIAAAADEARGVTRSCSLRRVPSASAAVSPTESSWGESAMRVQRRGRVR
jgi:hypothetical protein